MLYREGAAGYSQQLWQLWTWKASRRRTARSGVLVSNVWHPDSWHYYLKSCIQVSTHSFATKGIPGRRGLILRLPDVIGPFDSTRLAWVVWSFLLHSIFFVAKTSQATHVIKFFRERMRTHRIICVIRPGVLLWTVARSWQFTQFMLRHRLWAYWHWLRAGELGAPPPQVQSYKRKRTSGAIRIVGSSFKVAKRIILQEIDMWHMDELDMIRWYSMMILYVLKFDLLGMLLGCFYVPPDGLP